jgi:hypothetical protein
MQVGGEVPFGHRWSGAAAWLIAVALVAWAASAHEPSSTSAARLLTGWLAGLTLFLAGCAFMENGRQHPTALSSPWNRSDTTLVALSVALAIAVRFFELGSVPATFNGDEGSMSLEAMRVLNGEIRDPFVTGWLSHPTLWFYIQASGILVLGETVEGARAAPAAIGSATVAGTYVVGRLLFSRSVAAAGAILCACLGLHVHFSRMGMNNIGDPFWGVVTVSLWALAIRTGRLAAWAAAGVTAGLAFYFYPGARVFILVLLVLVGSETLSPYRGFPIATRPNLAMRCVAMVVGFVLAAAPVLRTFITRPDDFLARFAAARWTTDAMLAEAVVSGREPWQVIAEHVLRVPLAFGVYADRAFYYDDAKPILWAGAAVFFWMGVAILIARWRHEGPRALLVWLLLALLFGSVMLGHPPAAPRYVTLAPVVSLAIGVAIEWLVQLLKGIGKPWVLPSLSFLLVGGLSGHELRSYFLDFVPREQIGRVNTQIAMALARRLSEAPAGTHLWFMGAPHMFYDGFSTFRYLAPHVTGSDVVQPIRRRSDVPAPLARSLNIYAAMLERRDELSLVAAAFPGAWLKQEGRL